MKENMKKAVSVKKRIAKTHSKAEFVGILYLIATAFLAVMAFLPLVYGTSVGSMWVKNFWKPFLELKNIKTSEARYPQRLCCARICVVASDRRYQCT